MNPDDVDGDGVGECVRVCVADVDESGAEVDEPGSEMDERGAGVRGAVEIDVPVSLGGAAAPGVGVASAPGMVATGGAGAPS